MTKYHKNILDVLLKGHYVYVHNDARHKKTKCEIRNKDTHSVIRTIHHRTLQNFIDSNDVVFLNGNYHASFIQGELL